MRNRWPGPLWVIETFKVLAVLTLFGGAVSVIAAFVSEDTGAQFLGLTLIFATAVTSAVLAFFAYTLELLVHLGNRLDDLVAADDDLTPEEEDELERLEAQQARRARR